MIAIISDLISNQSIFSDPWSYVFSCIVSGVTGIAIEHVYRHYIIKNTVSTWKKYGVAYLLSLIIYIIANVVFNGFEIFRLAKFYIIGGIIMVTITPILYMVLRKVETYTFFLEQKKKGE
jgi:hypothetical protein